MKFRIDTFIDHTFFRLNKDRERLDKFSELANESLRKSIDCNDVSGCSVNKQQLTIEVIAPNGEMKTHNLILTVKDVRTPPMIIADPLELKGFGEEGKWDHITLHIKAEDRNAEFRPRISLTTPPKWGEIICYNIDKEGKREDEEAAQKSHKCAHLNSDDVVPTLEDLSYDGDFFTRRLSITWTGFPREQFFEEGPEGPPIIAFDICTFKKDGQGFQDPSGSQCTRREIPIRLANRDYNAPVFDREHWKEGEVKKLYSLKGKYVKIPLPIRDGDSDKPPAEVNIVAKVLSDGGIERSSQVSWIEEDDVVQLLALNPVEEGLKNWNWP